MSERVGLKSMNQALCFTTCIRKNIPVICLLVQLCSKCMADVVTENVNVYEGESATLNCYTERKSLCKWFIRGFELESNDKYATSSTRDQSGRMIHTLFINNVQRVDQGLYSFQDKTTKICNIQLYVRYIIKDPNVACMLTETNTSDHTSQTKETHSSLIDIKCTAYVGTNAFLNLTIHKSPGNQTLIPVHSIYKQQSNDEDGVSVNYSVDVSGLNGWRFWCVAEHPQIQPVNCSTSMLMTPIVTIVKLNQEFICKTHSYPDVITIYWEVCKDLEFNLINESRNCTKLSTGMRLPFSYINLIKDQLILVCEAINVVGTGKKHMNIRKDTTTGDIANGKGKTRPPALSISVVLLALLIVCISLVVIFKRRKRCFKRVRKVNSSSIGHTITSSNDNASETMSNLYAGTAPMTVKDIHATEITKTCEQQPVYQVLESSDT